MQRFAQKQLLITGLLIAPLLGFAQATESKTATAASEAEKSRPHEEGGGPEWRHDFYGPKIQGELNLNADQQRKWKEQRLLFGKKRIALRAEKSTLELDLLNLMQTYPVNKEELLKQGQKIADAERSLALLRVESLAALLETLTPDQHKKFLELQESLREKRKERMEHFRDKMEDD